MLSNLAYLLHDVFIICQHCFGGFGVVGRVRPVVRAVQLVAGLFLDAGQQCAVLSLRPQVAHVLDAPLASVYRMELTPASVTVLSYFRGGPEGTESMASMRLFNARPGGDVLPPGRM